MEDGKEAGDVVQGAGGDGLRKGGSEMEELHAGVEVKQCADSVKSHLEIPEGSDNDEKDRENFRTNGDDGIKNIENVSGAAEGNVSNNVEVRVVALDEGKEVQQLEVHEGKEEIQVSELPDADQGIQQSHILEGNKEIKELREPQSDDVQQLEGPDAREEVEQFEASHTGEEVQKLAASDGKEVQQAEASDVNLVQESKEHDARGELQQLETPDVKERTDNQDAEIQIDDDAVGMTEQPSNENLKNEPADPSSDAKEKKDHTKCGELPVVAEYQAEAVVPEGTVNVVLGAGDTVSNAIVENDGDKLDVLSEVDFDTEAQPENGMSQMEWNLSSEKVDESKENNFETHEKEFRVEMENPKANEQKLNSSLHLEGDESGTEEEQVSFIREVETFFKSRGTDFKPPKFYGEPLNLLKLWRAVIRLGGYEQVTSCKLWRQIGESFNPPKTCTTVSWTFRLFYEKALLEFEKHKMHDGDLPYDNSLAEFDTETQSGGSQGPGSGRVRRDSAARAMQGWHSQRALSNGEIGDPIVKDKSLGSIQKREKHAKSNDLASLKRKTTSPIEHPSKLARSKSPRPQMEISVIDVGEPANWVKINVRKTKDCFEIYALVPGLLREEVRVQSDPAGRLVISGEPQQLDNPWGVTPFKKVVSLPSRIDPHQTSAVVTLHGQLFVRVPFEQSDG